MGRYTLRATLVTLGLTTVVGAAWGTSERRIEYRPARWGQRPGCIAMVSKDECRRVVAQPAVVSTWTWAGKSLEDVVGGGTWRQWGDWGGR